MIISLNTHGAQSIQPSPSINPVKTLTSKFTDSVKGRAGKWCCIHLYIHQALQSISVLNVRYYFASIKHLGAFEGALASTQLITLAIMQFVPLARQVLHAVHALDGQIMERLNDLMWEASGAGRDRVDWAGMCLSGAQKYGWIKSDAGSLEIYVINGHIAGPGRRRGWGDDCPGYDQWLGPA